ncbi:hypothetical protein [Phenylobacterium sp. J367]|uniref:hypothetical protein n=1 Tax=Phenylobacterium sp. J367 TaxID=2898435 RepID=UPI002150FC32|nr:hypothetical protein [Phenylobacterium sp. J367]MCR5880859.1 hypothetical protein [Phenylobacterium sp. J367]
MTDLQASDRDAIGAVVDGMYEMISGPAGPRDWPRQPELFHPASRQMRTAPGDDGRSTITIMAPDEYRANVTPFFDANGFFEVEIDRRIDVMGNMAHVWSLYEARTAPEDAEPERRGINSIQLYKGPDGAWKIISMIWDNERPGVVAKV